DRRRNVGVVKRIVERIAKENEPTVMMRPNHADSAETAIKSRTVTVVRIIRGAVRRGPIRHVNPGLSRTAAHFTGSFLLRLTTGQPGCVPRHAGADLAFP